LTVLWAFSKSKAKTLEAHAEKLSLLARQLADPEQQQAVIPWSHPETDKAEGLKRQEIRQMKNHLYSLVPQYLCWSPPRSKFKTGGDS
jgi:hypothetical protein